MSPSGSIGSTARRVAPATPSKVSRTETAPARPRPPRPVVLAAPSPSPAEPGHTPPVSTETEAATHATTTRSTADATGRPAGPATGTPGPTPVATPGALAGTRAAPSAGDASGNVPARALLQPLPALPDDLRDDALRAVALARFSIHADGSVDVTLIHPTQSPRLNQLLLDSLRQWRFFPAMKNGQPVESTQDIRVHVNVD
ncbi:energy transducer TonB [Burkholderia sp. WAC0059]|nr:energy transducer TonB [Burkholderia sp. WAC0059]